MSGTGRFERPSRLLVGWLVVTGLLAVAPRVSAQLLNDECANATVVSTLPFTERLDLATATLGADEPASALCPASRVVEERTVWYRYTNDTGRDVRLVTDVLDADRWKTAYLDAGAGWFTGTCGALVETGVCGEGEARATMVVTPGQTVHVRVGDTVLAGSGGKIRVLIEEAPDVILSGGAAVRNAPDGKPALAVRDDGSFLAAWKRGAGGSVHAQLFDLAGMAAAPEIQLAATSDLTSTNRPPIAASSAPSGAFLVAWGEGEDVRAQLVDAAGGSVGGAFVVNGYTTGAQSYPSVAPDGAGGFRVVWQGPGPGDPQGVFTRVVDGAGTPVGVDTLVNDVPAPTRSKPIVASDETGDFVVIWDGARVGRAFDAAGMPLGPSFSISPEVTGGRSSGSSLPYDVARSRTGEFVVVFDGYIFDGVTLDPCTLWARVFDANATPVGSTICVTANTDVHEDDEARFPNVAAQLNEFVVVWEDVGGRTPGLFGVDDIRGRRMSLVGEWTSPEFEVNLLNDDDQHSPDVAGGPSGGIAAAWIDASGTIAPAADVVVGRVWPPPFPCAETPLAGCRLPVEPLQAKLLLNDASAAIGDESVSWKWGRGAATSGVDFGDPFESDDYALCAYDESGAPALVLAAAAPAGGTCGTKACWRAPAAGGAKYVDRERTPSGLAKLLLKPGDAGKAKIVVKGGGFRLSGQAGFPSLPLPLPLRVQLQGEHGECWEATFGPAGASLNTGTRFLGRGD